ncbi:MAG TPA: hypothetical protein VNO30_11195 [Kofleriaceae bacterium]|nr:hypothetical protein [Kofleriaceae bacterium]
MSRRRFALFGLVALAGVSAIWAGCTAYTHWEPEAVTWDGDRYEIVRRREGQAIVHDFVRSGRVVESLAGSMDLLCDEPYIFLFDVDGDGRLDVYHRHCGGHGYLKHAAATRTLAYENLGSVEIDDAPALDSFWAEEIRRWHGLRLLTGGVLALLIGTLGALGSALSSRRRERQSSLQRSSRA